MLNAPDFLKKALSTPWEALYYAEEVLDGPFPMGEIAIAQNPHYNRLYKEFLTTC
jgi:hypothetical protein